MRRILALLGVTFFLGTSFLGCIQTYPADKVKESIQKICRKEYGIERIDVKIIGDTIGVYLPIKKLFATDFKELLAGGGGKTPDVENLFHPSPEALDQVEDVLFSISRVLLSTDLKLKFYTLQATDEERTGLQLILSGYVDDIKRVRLWDISRNEYRKRVLHELKLNRAVIWHRPVRSFFRELEKSSFPDTVQRYFAGVFSPELFEDLFFINLRAAGNKTGQWRLGELRSTAVDPSRVLVRVPVQLEYDAATVLPGAFLVPSGTFLEYFFIISFDSESPKILRVIPLVYLDEAGKLQKISFPEEFELQRDTASWETEFSFSEIQLGDFLAEQLTRRVQALLGMDERVQNTFEEVRLAFRYRKELREDFFTLDLDVKLKTPIPHLVSPSAFHEDILYLLNLTSREFVEVLRSYQFSDYEFLQLNVASDPVSRILPREELELFRRNKVDLQGLLKGVSAL